MVSKDFAHGLLEEEDFGMSEVGSTLAQGLPVFFKLGENHFSYVLPTRVNLIIGTFMQLLCMVMAWSMITMENETVNLHKKEFRK